MRLLFIDGDPHGRYAPAAGYLAADGHQVMTIGRVGSGAVAGVRHFEYRPYRYGTAEHPAVRDLEAAVAVGVGVVQTCGRLDREGFVPDVVIGAGHTGETLYIKEVWPQRPLLGYCEGFGDPASTGTGSSGETPFPDRAALAGTLRAIELLALAAADWGQTPTAWQRCQYPTRYWRRISVVPEGVDSERAKPDPGARLWLSSGLSLGADDEVVACRIDARGSGPAISALPQILARLLRDRPRLHVLVWARAPNGEPAPQRPPPILQGCDPSRVLFLGAPSSRHLSAVMQVARVHLQLAEDRAGAGGLVDSLSHGAVIVASRHPMAEEIVRDGVTGFLVEPADIEKITTLIASAFDGNCASIRAQARETAIARYDRDRVCLPAYCRLLQSLADGKCPG